VTLGGRHVGIADNGVQVRREAVIDPDTTVVNSVWKGITVAKHRIASPGLLRCRRGYGASPYWRDSTEARLCVAGQVVILKLMEYVPSAVSHISSFNLPSWDENRIATCYFVGAPPNVRCAMLHCLLHTMRKWP
jgi:hypothetical protein